MSTHTPAPAHILVVDDEPDLRTLYELTLLREGYHVDVAVTQADAIQVSTQRQAGGEVVLGVWSDSPPMEQSVEQHLFEPFFSSESRSSGLGLYICRELCAGHGATIAFQRVRRPARDTLLDGNEFFITLRRQPTPDAMMPATRQPATP